MGIGRSQHLIPGADCELSLFSSDLLLMFPGHTLHPLPSSCLYSNFPIPPNSSTFNLSSSPIFVFSTTLHFFSISLLLAHFALKLSSPLLLFPTLTSCYHHHFSALTKQPSFSINLPCLLQISVSLPPLLTYFHPLIAPQHSCAS